MVNPSPSKNDSVTLTDLKSILEINQKAIEINVEVEKQNEKILNSLEEIEGKIHDIDKAFDNFKSEGIKDQFKVQHLTDDIKSLMGLVGDLKVDIEESTVSQKDYIEKIGEVHSSVADIDFTRMYKLVEELDRNFFRLTILLGTGLIGGVSAVIIKLFIR